jgi:hypothetical protein
MIDLEQVREFLPQYLSSESYEALLANLRAYPEQRGMYTQMLKGHAIVFQGDGFQDLLFVHLPDPEARLRRGMILSNTCDIYRNNARPFEARMVYAPMFTIAGYEQILRANSKKNAEAIAAHLASIRAQEITQIFFLPRGGALEEDSFVFLDRVQNAPLTALDESSIIARRFFTLSDFGIWLFSLKLSIHFCRFRENVDRGTGVIH